MGSVKEHGINPWEMVTALPPLQKQGCDYPACMQTGMYPAPRSRACNAYYWFCLNHVRDYNRTWDFYKDMTEAEIEHSIRSDAVWRRPTWPLGVVRSSRLHFGQTHGTANLFSHLLNKRSPYQQLVTETPETRAVRAMGLYYPVTRASVRTRYKELVKRLHPDTNGGDRITEEKLKIVIEAYKILMGSLG